MKSPFPGIDPYIEAAGLWADFHSHLVEKIAETIADALPERYTARTGERSYIVLVGAEGKESHPFIPDVGVSSSAREPAGETGETVALAEPTAEAGPVAMRPFIEEEYRETFVEIYEEAEQRLVTCIEVLSPSNKRPKSDGWDIYLRKRQGLLLGQAHLVEIDLLRGGQRLPMLDPWPSSPYTILIARARRVPRCLAWPVFFSRPLPVIPVPLLRPDADIPLNLQPLIEGIYLRYRYARAIDYSRPLTPPLGAEDVAWLEQQLRARQSAS